MTSELPSTLTGPAVCSLVAPGSCQFGEEPVSVPLLSRTTVSPTTAVLRFGLPDSEKPLNLSTCACLLAVTTLETDDTLTRPYTPISTNAQIGSFDLLVKNYGPPGNMSRLLHDIPEGSTKIQFKHIPFNVKTQAPFKDDKICMLVGGTGISPMIQALHAILGSDDCSTKVTLLYGSRTSDDILGKELVDAWAEQYKDQLTVVHVLSDEPADSAWTGARGFITKELIETHYGKEGGRVFVCGPPPMYDALCGARDQTDTVTGVLGDMGFTPAQVYKF